MVFLELNGQISNIMAKPISFRPSQENLEIFNELEENSNFDRTGFINKAITNFLPFLDKIKKIESEKRSQESMKNAYDSQMSGFFIEKRKVETEFESQLKTANNKIKELQGQLFKCQEDREIFKSKNDFLTAETSNLDKNTLKELGALRAKVVEQSKQVSSLMTEVVDQSNEIVTLKKKVTSYENPYLENAFEKVKGTKQTAQHEGSKDVTFSIDSMADLVKALSYKYNLNFLK